MATHADSRDILFKVRKQGTWESLDITKEHPKVTGKKYKLEEVGEIQSPIPGAFAFVNLQQEGAVDSAATLEAPPMWNVNELTSRKLADILEQFLDKVSILFFLQVN